MPSPRSSRTALTVLAIASVGLLGVVLYPFASALLFAAVLAAAFLVDNLLKPVLMRRIDVHGAVIFFALVGGLAVFGPVGLVAGPLILSFFLAMARIWRGDVLTVSPQLSDRRIGQKARPGSVVVEVSASRSVSAVP
jgi:predicted PurR-regulated permease PerM